MSAGLYPPPPGWSLFAHGDELYRGPDRRLPVERWCAGQRAWVAYRGATPKPDGWGAYVGEWTARFMFREFEPFSLVPDFGTPTSPVPRAPTLSELESLFSVPAAAPATAHGCEAPRAGRPAARRRAPPRSEPRRRR